MPRKKAASNKARLELRFDRDVYEGIKGIAEEADLSLNQLMEGITRWAIQYAYVGFPNSNDYVKTREYTNEYRPKQVWFGREKHEPYDAEDQIPATIYFMLDYSSRRAVLDMPGCDPNRETRIDAAGVDQITGLNQKFVMHSGIEHIETEHDPELESMMDEQIRRSNGDSS
jgi:hypothetical protein